MSKKYGGWLENLIWRWRGHLKFWWQRQTRGWGDDELWSLDYTIAEFVLPRLRGLRDLKKGVPWAAFEPEDLVGHEISEEAMKRAEKRWQQMLDEMIFGFEFHLQVDVVEHLNEAKNSRAIEGRKLFAEHFGSLWW